MTIRMTSDEAVAALRAGRVVALPSDTVYGLGASLAHRTAVERLFALKRRPSSVALPVIADSLTSIEKLGVEWSLRARRLSDAFWPGPLTIVVATPTDLATLVGNSSDAVGFRIPNDVVLRDVVGRTGPIALTSANEHGATPCTTAEEVLELFEGRSELAGVIDAGERSAPVSSVVELFESTWRVRREGAISVARLAAVLDSPE